MLSSQLLRYNYHFINGKVRHLSFLILNKMESGNNIHSIIIMLYIIKKYLSESVLFVMISFRELHVHFLGTFVGVKK